MAIKLTPDGFVFPGGAGGILVVPVIDPAADDTFILLRAETVDNGVRVFFTVPDDKTVTITTTTGIVRTFNIPGPSDETFLWSELGNPTVGEPAVISAGVEEKRQYRIVRPLEETPPEPFVFLTDPIVETTGIEGEPITITPPTWSGIATLTITPRTSDNDDPETGPFEPIGGDVSVVPPYSGPGVWVSFEFVVNPEDGSEPVVRVSTPFEIQQEPVVIVAPEAAFTAGQYAAISSYRRPATNSATFSPILDFSTLTDLQKETIQIEFRATPFGELSAPWFPVARYPDDARYFYLVPGAFAPLTPSLDESLFIDDSRRDRLRFRHRFADNQEWSPATSAITVPLPPALDPGEPDPGDPPPATIYALNTTEIAPVRTMRQLRFFSWRRKSENGGHGVVGSPFGMGRHVALAVSAFAGDTHVLPGVGSYSSSFQDGARPGGPSSASVPAFPSNQTPAQRMVTQLRYWGNAEQNLPRGHGSYGSQYELAAVCMIAIGRKTPAVWNALTAIEKQRLTVYMKGAMVGHAWVDSNWHNRGSYGATVDGFPVFTTTWYYNKSVRNCTSGRSSNPNFSSPPQFIPRICALFLAEDGINAQTYMDNWTRASFLAECDACDQGSGNGVQDVRETFAQDWTESYWTSWWGQSRSTVNPPNSWVRWSRMFTNGHVTDAMIQRAISSGAHQPGGGGWTSNTQDAPSRLTIFQASQMAINEINRGFSKTIQPGPRDKSGGETGPGWTTRHGVKKTSTGPLRGVLGRGGKEGWSTIPNRGLPHRAFELDTNDGGESGGPNVRASMSYARQSTLVLAMGLAAIAVYDALDPGPNVPAAMTKLQIGIQDLRHGDLHGWLSYAKGGSGSTNNENWTSGDQGDFNATTEFALFEMFLRYAATKV